MEQKPSPHGSETDKPQEATWPFLFNLKWWVASLAIKGSSGLAK